MTQKTFSVAGVSTFKGATKVRFANDFVNRIKILAKNEHTDVELIELGGEYTKAEVAQILLAHPKFQNETAQSAIAEYVVRNVKTIKQQKETVEAEQPVVEADFEDAPF
jgi:CTP synthase (UTP-ammonia lyase)